MKQSETATESVIKSDVTFDLPAVVESDVDSTQVSLTKDDEASNANVELSQFAKVISSETVEQNSQNVESSISQESASSYYQSSSAQESSSSAVEANSEQTTVEPQSEVTEKSAQVEVSTDESSVPLVQVSLQQVQNIPDIIASLENENKAQQVFFKIIWTYVFVNFVFTCETVNKTMFQTGRAVNELAVQAG